MNIELTNAEKLRRIHWNTALNGFNSVFAQLTFFGSAFPLFLAELNFTNSQIGFLLSLIPFFGLVALFAAPMAARFGYKRTFVTFFGTRKAITTFLLLAPWVLTQYGEHAVLIYVMIVMIGFSLTRAIAETAIYPWAQEFIPNAIRGRYSAVNEIVSRLTAIAAIALAGVILALPMGLNRYVLMFIIALFFGWAAVWASAHIAGGAPVKVPVADRASFRSMFRVLKDKNFALYLTALSLVTIGIGPVGSFLPLFMKREVGLSDSNVVLLQIGTLFGGLASTYLLGWAADRYGSKPVMLSGVYMKIVLPIAWLLMPRFSPLSLPVALVISVLNGIADIAWALGVIRLLYVGVVPEEKKTQYMAMYYAISGVIGGLSQVIGGRVVDLSSGLSGHFLFFTLDPFSPLFFAGILFPLVGLFLFNAVRADSRVSVGEFAGMFIHGNPFLALEFMVRYYRAKDERTTVVMTERMAKTKSPLTVNELLEALEDPRFNVRFEAVISIARMDSDPRLIESLCAILDGTELSLTTISAWALGRMGDESALPSLRKGLDSEYRSIRAHCARALSTLGDTTVIPLLHERLQTETDKGLRVAYAAALGQLGSPEAVETLFAILDEIHNDGARMELALSIARLLGHEQAFIRLLRQVRQDMGTASSQTISGVKKKLSALNAGALVPLVDGCASAFARDDIAGGVAQLCELVSQLPKDAWPEVGVKIATECEQKLRAFGPTHLEYIILLLYTLDTIASQQGKSD